ncbi:hypothetical protein BMQ_pBM20013 (plasmid) [Priestia megaterium QM B1551]|uniref:Uncharacterized protein n=1 Tax=Priestia megaterium (strain ATCC 12872 / QMB1551) TaxID=545693 RepID=D5E396_PRIM1|nr:hypothetical protein BMQ_pBM20013 [Priestia megaterium QM B1551]
MFIEFYLFFSFILCTCFFVLFYWILERGIMLTNLYMIYSLKKRKTNL